MSVFITLLLRYIWIKGYVYTYLYKFRYLDLGDSVSYCPVLDLSLLASRHGITIPCTCTVQEVTAVTTVVTTVLTTVVTTDATNVVTTQLRFMAARGSHSKIISKLIIYCFKMNNTNDFSILYAQKANILWVTLYFILFSVLD